MPAAAAGARACPGRARRAATACSRSSTALFQLHRRLARDRPLVLCIDDLQWSDPASLRFVAYLARRIAGLPVLVAATIRTGEPDADEALLGELAQDPATVAVQPAAADRGRHRAAWSRDGLGERPTPRSPPPAMQVTAGNPLLLRQLLSALAAEHVSPDDAQRRRGARRSARARWRARCCCGSPRLPAPGRGVARAVAVLGEQPGLRAVAALAGPTSRPRPRRVQRSPAPRSCAATSRSASCTRWSATPSTRAPAARRGARARARGAAARRPRRRARAGRRPAHATAPPRGDPWVVDAAARGGRNRAASAARPTRRSRSAARPGRAAAARAARGAGVRARRRRRVRARPAGVEALAAAHATR